jgi:hypothetical protein
MTRKFTVTAAGKEALSAGITLTSDVIELTNGDGPCAWTIQSTFVGDEPLDDEGWAPWMPGDTIEVALEKGYIKELS